MAASLCFPVEAALLEKKIIFSNRLDRWGEHSRCLIVFRALPSRRMNARFILAVAQWLCVSGMAQQHYVATNLWKTYVGWGSQSSPALGHDGAIYVGTWEGLVALHPTGAERWRFRTRVEIASSPAIAADGTVYVGCRDRKFYAVDKDGRKQWTFKTGGWVDASAAIGADGTIYFGSWDKNFYALNPDGSKKWEFVTRGPVVSSAAIDANGVIYFGSHDRKFYALNPDGSKRWEYATGGAILSSPAIGEDGALYFTSVDGKFHVVNADGTRRWVLPTGGITRASPVIGLDGTIYIGVNDQHCAISAEGKMKWQRGLDPRGHVPFDWIVSTPAVLANGSVLMSGTDLALTALMPDGDWWWTYSLQGGSRSSPLVGSDATVYGANDGMELHAIRNTVPLAATPWPMFRGNPQHTGRARAVP